MIKTKIELEDIGIIMQQIYDSEISLQIGWLWDGGFSYSLQNTPYPLAGTSEKTIMNTGDKLQDSFMWILSDIIEKYPNSSFTAWFSEHYETPLPSKEKIRVQREVATDILILLDDLEIKQPEALKTDNWRNWKYIRNAIVDKYNLRTQLDHS